MAAAAALAVQCPIFFLPTREAAMPHLTLEYSSNLPGFDAQAALAHVNQMLDASGLFREIDIKSRAYPCPQFQVGLADSGRGFIHARIAIMPGRTVHPAGRGGAGRRAPRAQRPPPGRPLSGDFSDPSVLVAQAPAAHPLAGCGADAGGVSPTKWRCLIRQSAPIPRNIRNAAIPAVRHFVALRHCPSPHFPANLDVIADFAALMRRLP